MSIGVEMKVVTWNRDSHGLFDYESKAIAIKRCFIEQPSKVFRSGDSDVEIVEINQSPVNTEDNYKYLTSIMMNNNIKNKDQIIQQETNGQNGLFYLNPSHSQNPIEGSSEEDNFLIVRSLKNPQGKQKGYQLEVGDVVKLGRVEYLVVEIKDETGQINRTDDPLLKQIHNVYTVPEEDEDLKIEKRTCKICLGDQESEDDFFVSPCKCKGTCEFVHFQCLKKWVESKVSKKQQETCLAYSWKKGECEICKEPLPKKIRKGGEELELVDIERPEVPYLMLQLLADRKASKNLFIIYGVPELEVPLGRGHQCSVRISDISVSRIHAQVKYIDKKFMITDNNSKFGTLIKVRKPIQITDEKIAVQVGRTVITFFQKQNNIQQGQLQQVQQIQKLQQPLQTQSSHGQKLLSDSKNQKDTSSNSKKTVNKF